MSNNSKIPSPNQLTRQDDQNFNIDIDKIYSDFIQSIDAVRSYTNCSTISDKVAKDIFTSGDLTLSQLKQQIQVLNTYQESRCHAFYRIIGFPVIGSDMRIYNPGYDTVYDTKRAIGAATSFEKLVIAGDPIEGFRDLSKQRELINLTYLSIFNWKSSITASALALSGVNSRTFASSLEKSSKEAFDTVINDQQYTRDFRMGMAYSNGQNLSDYIDASGNKPKIGSGFTIGQIPNQWLHIISPFMVDPVIDFSVNDASRLIAVPFVPNKSNLKIKEDMFVSRPIIEQVIRDRISILDQNSELGEKDKDTINYVKSLNITDPVIINAVNSNAFKTGQQEEFSKFVNIIRAMILELVSAKKDVGDAQAYCYYVPVPSVTGPEGGCTTQDVFISQYVPSTLLSANDVAIINATIKNSFNLINTGTVGVNATPDIGGFSFDSFKNTFGPETSAALGDASSDNLQKLNKKRSNILQKGNEGLRTIEIIMGEFSGLGLCDIIAIMGALYIMDEGKLLGFLDSDSIDRMNNALGTSYDFSSLSINDTMIEFTQNVLAFYNLMDSIYINVSQKNQK